VEYINLLCEPGVGFFADEFLFCVTITNIKNENGNKDEQSHKTQADGGEDIKKGVRTPDFFLPLFCQFADVVSEGTDKRFLNPVAFTEEQEEGTPRAEFDKIAAEGEGSGIE